MELLEDELLNKLIDERDSENAYLSEEEFECELKKRGLLEVYRLALARSNKDS